MLTLHIFPNKNFALCLRLIFVGYTIEQEEVVEVCDVIFEGVQGIVTKCDDGAVGLIFP